MHILLLRILTPALALALVFWAEDAAVVMVELRSVSESKATHARVRPAWPQYCTCTLLSLPVLFPDTMIRAPKRSPWWGGGHTQIKIKTSNFILHRTPNSEPGNQARTAVGRWFMELRVHNQAWGQSIRAGH